MWLVDDRATRHLRRSVSKAVMREGRTDSVRPRLADRLAAKDKIFPRVLDGNSAHPRTPGADSATLQATTGPEHFSFRRCFSVSVTLRQPKVTAQLPTGGDVSYPPDAVGSVLFGGCASVLFTAVNAARPPRKAACACSEQRLNFAADVKLGQRRTAFCTRKRSKSSCRRRQSRKIQSAMMSGSTSERTILKSDSCAIRQSARAC